VKVGFYIPGYDHLGISYLSACLKEAGHETVGFFDPMLCNEGAIHSKFLARLLDMEDYVVDEILASDIDLMAFSVVTGNFIRARRIAGKLKARRDILTVFGGIHCCSAPELVIEETEVDYMVVGEGEYALVDLANHIENGQDGLTIPNVWHKVDGQVHQGAVRPTIDDLDSLPFPDKEVFHASAPGFVRLNYRTAASRGCCNACTYCLNSWIRKLYEGKGRWRRRRSVDNLLDELKQAKEKYHFEAVRFWDDLFLDDWDWIAEFADKYPRAIGKPFFCFGHARFIDEDVAEMLDRAGCREVNLGVETVGEGTRKDWLKRTDTMEEIATAIEVLRPTKIFVSTGNILGLPGQSIDEALEMARFYNDHRVDLPSVHYFQYYPNTEIVTMALEHGLLTPEDVREIANPQGQDRSFFHSDRKDMDAFSRIRTVVHLTTILPKVVIRTIIERGWWRHIPAFQFYPAIFVIAAFVKRVRTGKQSFVESYTLARYGQVMCACVVKKALWRLRSLS
jgi:radical SAM superfamily enzyme YgiQ (UPF0313 family)